MRGTNLRKVGDAHGSSVARNFGPLVALGVLQALLDCGTKQGELVVGGQVAARELYVMLLGCDAPVAKLRRNAEPNAGCMRRPS